MNNTCPIPTSRTRRIYRVTIVGSLVNFVLLLFKFAAGIWGRSSAMLADAVHSLSDFATDIVVLIFVRISAKPCDETHDYGHGKYETLASTLIALMLLAVGVGICWHGLRDIWNYLHGETLARPGAIALTAALVSIVLKEGLFRYTIAEARRTGSQAVEANAWHHRSDALSSIGTAAGIAGAIFFGVKGRVLDPIAAVAVSFFILRAASRIFAASLDELLERSLPRSVENQILSTIGEFAEAHQPHNLRTRRIGNCIAIDVHVRMDPEMTVGQSHAITTRIEQQLKAKLGLNTYVNIHVEPLKLAGSPTRDYTTNPTF